MKLSVFQSADLAANYVCELLVDRIKVFPSSVLGLATGGTTVPLYNALVKSFREGEVSFAQATTFNLDEYIGLPEGHVQSYRCFMNTHLFNIVDIKQCRIHFPDVTAENLSEAGLAYDRLIEDAGSIDFQLLGIGRNGHIGFNEPDASFDAASGIRELSETTRADNQRFFTAGESVPSHALSMSIDQILKARKIVLMATGFRKADALARLFSSQYKLESFPASALIDHHNVEIVCDSEAAINLDLAGHEVVCC